MRYKTALITARNIMQEFPQLYLSGSVALILAGKLPLRDVADIDFACHVDEVPTDSPLVFWNDDGSGESSGCRIFDVKCCIFGNQAVMPGPIIDGFKLWDIDDILAKKREFDRLKDIVDALSILAIS